MPPKLDNYIVGVITQSFNWNYRFSLGVCEIFQEYPIFANFTIGMIGNETGHSLKCPKLYGKFINKNET